MSSELNLKAIREKALKEYAAKSTHRIVRVGYYGAYYEAILPGDLPYLDYTPAEKLDNPVTTLPLDSLKSFRAEFTNLRNKVNEHIDKPLTKQKPSGGTTI